MNGGVVLAGIAAVAAPAAAADPPVATAAGVKVVEVHDNFYSPAKLTVKRGTTIVWRWPDVPIDVHDVRLEERPKGVRRFQSAPASSSYTFKRRLKVPGRYGIVCALHHEMTMTIRVKR